MIAASVIVPSYAGATRLPRLLAALEQQTHADWEAVVVLDGEVDDSAQVLRRFGDRLPLRTVILPTNQGRVAALNAGFREARGEILIRCDDDFEPAPHHVAAHVAAHEQRECGVIGLPRNIAPDSAYLRVYGHDADERHRQAALAAPPDQRWRFWGGNTSVSREVFGRVGEFDDRYRGYGWEDVDFGYRVHRLGIQIEVVPAAEVRHHMASIDTRTRAQRAFWSGQARRQFEAIHGSEVSSPPGAPTWWSRATATVARGLDDRRTERLGSAIDRALPVIPAPLGRKAVALLVESAGLAGFTTRQCHSGPGQDRAP